MAILGHNLLSRLAISTRERERETVRGTIMFMGYGALPWCEHSCSALRSLGTRRGHPHSSSHLPTVCWKIRYLRSVKRRHIHIRTWSKMGTANGVVVLEAGQSAAQSTTYRQHLGRHGHLLKPSCLFAWDSTLSARRQKVGKEESLARGQPQSIHAIVLRDRPLYVKLRPLTNAFSVLSRII